MSDSPAYSKVDFPLTDRIEDPFDLANHFPCRLALVSNLLQLNRDASIKNISGLEPKEFQILLCIGSFMPIKAADIAYLGRLDSYVVSRAVKTLLKEELISIEFPENNKKSKNLVLTDKGVLLYRHIGESIVQRTKELESVITPEEKSELIRILTLLESKSESMIASHAIREQQLGHNIPADQKEIIRWYKRSCATSRLIR